MPTVLRDSDRPWTVVWRRRRGPADATGFVDGRFIASPKRYRRGWIATNNLRGGAGSCHAVSLLNRLPALWRIAPHLSVPDGTVKFEIPFIASAVHSSPLKPRPERRSLDFARFR